MLTTLLQLIATVLSVTYLVLDGHFGHHNALHMARQCGLHLISKLRCDAALYFPYVGPYAGRGPRRTYGDKVDYDNLPEQYGKETTVEGHIKTQVYQMQLLHKEFAQPLNVVIIAKTNLRTQARAHVVLFSSDCDLAYAPLVDYYGLRFQIEFNFRDAKQHWGLEDFMNRGIEEPLAPALGVLAIAGILGDVGDQARIEDALPVMRRIKAAIQIEIGPSKV